MQTLEPLSAIIWSTLYSFQLGVILPTMIALGFGHLYPFLGMIPYIETTGIGYSAIKYWREQREVKKRFGKSAKQLKEVQRKYHYRGMPDGVSFFEVLNQNNRQIVPVVQAYQAGVAKKLQELEMSNQVLTTEKLEQMVDNKELADTLLGFSGDSHVYQKLLLKHLLTDPEKRTELLEAYGQIEYYERNIVSHLMTKMDRAQEQINSFQMAYTPSVHLKVIFSHKYRLLFFRTFKVNRDLAKEKSALRMLQYALTNDLIEQDEVDFEKYERALSLVLGRIKVLKSEMKDLVENNLTPIRKYSRQMTCEHPFLGLVQ